MNIPHPYNVSEDLTALYKAAYTKVEADPDLSKLSASKRKAIIDSFIINIVNQHANKNDSDAKPDAVEESATPTKESSVIEEVITVNGTN